LTSENRIKGLSLKVGPLGEHDRLLTILSDKEGIIRLAIPGARRPKSSLAATSPLTFLDLHVFGKSSLKKVRQIKVLRSYSKLGQCIETLAAAQALTELILMLVANNDPQPNILDTVLIHLERLESIKNNANKELVTLAHCVQSCVHILALGGYCIPLQTCARSGMRLEPPLGEWEWKCSFFPQEGFVIGDIPAAEVQLNPSELALLQRLLNPNIPMNRNGEIIGPKKVWLKLLLVLEIWINNHLPKKVRSLQMLREVISSSNEPENISNDSRQ
tara:strand:+ start:11671 stop:12492 length:822 start_codon:yes stop_codon:yes gene_type:complete